MALEYHNQMEDILLPLLENMLENDDGCKCDNCKSCMMAYALNHVQPHYVSSYSGGLIARANQLERQSSADMIAALIEAMRVVREHPRHTEQDLMDAQL